MGLKKITGIPEVDGVIAGLNKLFKVDVITNERFEKCQAIPTGSTQLDSALGIGGIPMGRIIEIYGPESSGKTSLALQFLANWQKNQDTLGQEGYIAAVIDVEGSLSDEFMAGFGIDVDNILRIPDPGIILTAEQALQVARDLPKSGKVGFILYDSIGGTQKLKQMEADIGKADVGGISKLMHDTMRQLSKVAKAQNCTCIFINHLTKNPGVMFGSPETTPGGHALGYFASLRLRMQSPAVSKAPNSFKMRVGIKKTKVAPPWADKIHLDFEYAKGVDPIIDLYEYAKSIKAARQASAAFYICWLEGDEKQECKGVEGALELLRTDEELRTKLEARCMEIANDVNPTMVGPADEESEDEEQESD